MDMRPHACAHMDVEIVRAADVACEMIPNFLEDPAAKLAVIS